MENDFFAILAGHPALLALVPVAKITPVKYTQGVTGTLIRYTKITGIPGLHMQGSDGLTESLMQIDVRAATYGEAIAVRNVLVGPNSDGGLLHPFRGLMGSTDFRLIYLANDRGVLHEKTGAQEFHTTSLDFAIRSRAAD
jgi:hypothetical protein